MSDIVIVSAARTPVGSFNGALASLPAHELGKIAIQAAVERAGISAAEPGYGRIRFAPVFAEQVEWAAARVVTARGEAGIRWERVGASITLELDVPPGCSAVLCLRGHGDRELGPGHHRIVVEPG